MAQDVKGLLKTDSIPSNWTVVRARKGKSAWKGLSDLFWGGVFVLLAIGLPWFLGEELSDAVRWIVLGVGLLIGLFLIWSGFGKLIKGAVGALVITEDEVVVLAGTEKRYPLAEYIAIRTMTRTGQGQAIHSELELEHKDGRRVVIAESDTYGNDLSNLVPVIEAKLGTPRERVESKSDHGIHSGDMSNG